jgi:hypothetical protein
MLSEPMLSVPMLSGPGGVEPDSPRWPEHAPDSPPECDQMPSSHWTIEPRPLSKVEMQRCVAENPDVPQPPTARATVNPRWLI